MKKIGQFLSKKRFFIPLVIIVVVASSLVFSANPVPYRLATEYAPGMILKEGIQMHECAECHEGADFHTCETCHNEHGGASLPGLSFYSTVELTGDVPEQKYIPTNLVFVDEGGFTLEKVSLFEFLEKYGVSDFESITFETNDGGFVTLAYGELGPESYLLPYDAGVRFADENLHVSTWLKGITKMLVVSQEESLLLGNTAASIGKLMLGDTTSITVEQAPVMLRSEETGEIRRGFTATRLEGIEVSDWMEVSKSSEYNVDLADGGRFEISGLDLQNSLLTKIYGDIVLVFPEKSRNQWIFGVKGIGEK